MEERSSHLLPPSHLPGVRCCIACRCFVRLIRSSRPRCEGDITVPLILQLKEWNFRKLKVACGRSHSWQGDSNPGHPDTDSMLVLRPFSSLCGTVTQYTLLRESSLFPLHIMKMCFLRFSWCSANVRGSSGTLKCSCFVSKLLRTESSIFQK